MKYRIKTITYKDGSVKYTVEYNYWWIFWKLLNKNGGEIDTNIHQWYYNVHYKFISREQALEVINKHYNSRANEIEKSIQIEYINK